MCFNTITQRSPLLNNWLLNRLHDVIIMFSRNVRKTPECSTVSLSKPEVARIRCGKYNFLSFTSLYIPEFQMNSSISLQATIL